MMRYIKLFEKFIEEPKFYRFNQFDLLGDKGEMQFTPKLRKMVGPENVNRVLVKNGFPDKHRCIHFMDSLAFNPDYKGLYGNFIWAFKENYDIFSVVDEFDFQKWKKVIYF